MCFFKDGNLIYIILGPQGPLGLPPVDPIVRSFARANNRDHLYSGLFAPPP